MSKSFLENKEVVERHLRKERSSLSCFSFVNIFAWKDFFDFEFEIIDGCLCVFARNEMGQFLYLPPIGLEISSEAIERCFCKMEKVNKANGVTRVENVCQSQLCFFPEDKYDRVLKDYEYCYYREDVAALKGNKYKAKRSSYNQFVANNTFEYLLFDKGMLGSCLRLYKKWALNRRKVSNDDVYQYMLDENEHVHALVLKYYQELSLIGRVVMIDGGVVAYSFGYEINETVFCVLFEIADISFKGLSAYIFREFCRDDEVKNYKFINVMDDSGLKNIRRVKMSFHPKVLLPMYVITKK